MKTIEHANKMPLAECDICQVEHCTDCDVVHVHVRHTSLRLTLSGYFAMCATLLDAARRIKHADIPVSRVHTGLQ
jgi:hypothetical protein